MNYEVQVLIQTDKNKTCFNFDFQITKMIRKFEMQERESGEYLMKLIRLNLRLSHTSSRVQIKKISLMVDNIKDMEKNIKSEKRRELNISVS